ncbi:MAG: hypothetical protein A3I89_04105 [Candidatus Harrisonbacteria bacterium RIFCSPLOWO2_02_FULL_41_11]|uniref:Uncharacterized protein n=1 Tax=Candidatus Harrisonbacteria bacterium RIFCSPHIGHO2_02_FULL_42_16 TaxID=1798404 RepID=A0A1G1ZJ65_9BACT|nr:MAG: hypothetical protein A3B92_01160 [Candidatus Harrisonbacteria bacterium RIFCSPHIGHO2_02_FULL_42_16]OGY67162.1 MAG: hypothetical protein A3I89_04105 [Candidatus Harrisonbacteria bacterium RIFCSPLOWO2_02_FULL_41_11]
MKFPEFADAMEKVGFRNDEPLAPKFKLNKSDLQDLAFKDSHTKVVGFYRVISIWSEGGEVALWAQEDKSGTKLFPFQKEEVEFLVKRNKFKKN